MPRKKKPARPASKSKSKSKSKPKSPPKKKRELAIRGDTGFCIGGEWAPRGDE